MGKVKNLCVLFPQIKITDNKETVSFPFSLPVTCDDKPIWPGKFSSAYVISTTSQSVLYKEEKQVIKIKILSRKIVFSIRYTQNF